MLPVLEAVKHGSGAGGASSRPPLRPLGRNAMVGLSLFCRCFRGCGRRLVVAAAALALVPVLAPALAPRPGPRPRPRAEHEASLLLGPSKRILRVWVRTGELSIIGSERSCWIHTEEPLLLSPNNRILHH